MYILHFCRNIHIFSSEPEVTVICSTCPLFPSKSAKNFNILGLPCPNCKQGIHHQLSAKQFPSTVPPSRHITACAGETLWSHSRLSRLHLEVRTLSDSARNGWLDVNCQGDASQENPMDKSCWVCVMVVTSSSWCFSVFLVQLPCPALCTGGNICSFPNNTYLIISCLCSGISFT